MWFFSEKRKRASCIQRNEECFIQGGARASAQYNAEPKTAELLLRIIVSVNQRVNGAVADWCQDLAQQIKAHSPPSTGTPVANVEDDPASQVPQRTKITNLEFWSPRRLGAATRKEIRTSSRKCSINESLPPFPPFHMEGYGSTTLMSRTPASSK